MSLMAPKHETRSHEVTGPHLLSTMLPCRELNHARLGPYPDSIQLEQRVRDGGPQGAEVDACKVASLTSCLL